MHEQPNSAGLEHQHNGATSLLGKPAVDFALTDTAGSVHRLSDYAGRWMLLVFRRHLGCLPCHDHLMQLRDEAAEIERLGMSAAVVTFEEADVARIYAERTKCPWPILLDTERTLYHAYGMYHAKWWNLLKPKAMLLYFKLMARGDRVRRPTGDVKQLGGDVVIDPAGIVRMHWVAPGPADLPDVEQVLGIVRGREAMRA